MPKRDTTGPIHKRIEFLVIDEDLAAEDPQRDDVVLGRASVSINVSLDAPTKKISRTAIMEHVVGVLNEIDESGIKAGVFVIDSGY